MLQIFIKFNPSSILYSSEKLMKMYWESGINQKYEFQGLSTISCKSTNKKYIRKSGKTFWQYHSFIQVFIEMTASLILPF